MFPTNLRFWQPLLDSQLKLLERKVSTSQNELQEINIASKISQKAQKKIHKNHGNRDNKFENYKFMAPFKSLETAHCSHF